MNVNIHSAQLAYRAPYVYFAQSAERVRVVRIGQTMRPTFEFARLQRRHQHPIVMLLAVRAYAVLAPILWARFAHCSVGRQWFLPDRRLLRLIEILSERDPEQLLQCDALRDVLAEVFPENPYQGVALYRVAETCIRRSRR